MQVSLYPDPRAFLARVREYLEAAEALNNLLLGLCLRLSPADTSALLVAVEEEEGELMLAGLMTPTRKLNLYSHLPYSSEAVTALARHLCRIPWQVPGVLGVAPLALAFAQAWRETTGRSFALGMPMGLYELRQVRAPAGASGQLRLARVEDLDLLTGWAVGFDQEVWKRPPAEGDVAGARRQVEGKIAAQELYLWEVGGEPACMASSARPTRRGIAVNYVYTPPPLRGRGYARACVAALSQRLLDAGFAFCTLFADLDNPVSNRVYQQVGYQLLVEFAEYEFGD